MLRRLAVSFLLLVSLPSLGFAQSTLTQQLIALAERERPQASTPMTLDAYQWAQEHERAVQAKGRAKVWMITGIAAIGGAVAMGAAAPGARGTTMLIMSIPGAAMTAIGYLGGKRANERLRELEARRPKSSEPPASTAATATSVK